MDTDAGFPLPFKSCAEEAADRASALLVPVIRKGAVYADLFLEESKEASIGAGLALSGTSAPQFRTTERTTAGMALRAFDSSKHLLKHSPGWEPDSWQEMAGTLAAGFARQDSVEEMAVDHRAIKWIDDRVLDSVEMVSVAEKQYVLASLIDALYSYCPDISYAAASLQQEARRTFLANTQGDLLGAMRARYGIRLDVKLNALEPALAYVTKGFMSGFGEMAFDGGADLVREIAGRMKRMAASRPIESGNMPVVFAGGWAGLWLHETLGHLLEADVAPASLSTGEVIGGEMLSVYDDATLDGLQGSCAVDDEGVPANRTTLVNKGRVEHLLTDRYQAQRCKLPLTGNGRRAHYTEAPLPRMTNLGLVPGAAAPDALIASVQQGLFVKQASAGVHHAGSHCDKVRAFELIVNDGYVIERGELTHPVRNIVISGQSLQVVQKIVAVGNDVLMDKGYGVCEKAGQVIPVSVNTPTVLIEDLNVRQI